VSVAKARVTVALAGDSEPGIAQWQKEKRKRKEKNTQNNAACQVTVIPLVNNNARLVRPIVPG